jgi:hypothetical protein
MISTRWRVLTRTPSISRWWLRQSFSRSRLDKRAANARAAAVANGNRIRIVLFESLRVRRQVAGIGEPGSGRPSARVLIPANDPGR